MRKVLGCTQLEKFRNEDIRRDLQIFSLNNRIPEYKHQRFQHVQQMENGSCTVAMFTTASRDWRERERKRQKEKDRYRYIRM
jgi:hypothetical protein